MGWASGTHLRPTDRQLEALALALCYGNKGAASRLGIAEQSLKNRLSGLYSRLGIGDMGRMGARDLAAIQLGWLRIPPEFAGGDE